MWICKKQDIQNLIEEYVAKEEFKNQVKEVLKDNIEIIEINDYTTVYQNCDDACSNINKVCLNALWGTGGITSDSPDSITIRVKGGCDMSPGYVDESSPIYGEYTGDHIVFCECI